MNQLQQTQLSLLERFLAVCEEYDLTYYLVCGSALGAVKYGGFIPWDDDIDVALPREDYQRFLELSPERLPDWCFLQNYRTDPAFPHCYSKLRDNRTTFLEAGVRKLDMNHGIYLDIFPLDGYPAGQREARRFEQKKRLLRWMQCCALDYRASRKIQLRDGLFRLLGFHKRTARTLERMEALYTRFSPGSSAVWCNHGNWQGRLDYSPREHYGRGTHARFEGLDVIIPENYDAYLTQKYGPWREVPPDGNRRTHHEVLICDPERSYLEYRNRL